MTLKKKETAVSGKERILKVSAELFSELGYERASIRQISEKSGMKTGSVYYFFNSKADILLEIQERGFALISKRVQDAIEEESDPWGRLYSACTAHLEGIFEYRSYIEVTVRELPDRHPEPLRKKMKRFRRRYEDIFVKIIEDLPLKEDIDRSYFRLSLLGAMAWTLVWYDNEGRYSPKETARKMIDFLRYSSST